MGFEVDLILPTIYSIPEEGGIDRNSSFCKI
jgi:hypothetical protein